jgi:cytoskeletal protein RodZ
MTSFGASLRRERELRGVSLQEISSSTKIGVSMLRAIEDDRFDKLPQGLFVRGFVREYARFLALDEQKVLTELSFHASQAVPVPDASAIAAIADGEKRSQRFSARMINGGIMTAIVGAVVALILSPGFSRQSAPSTVISTLPQPAPTAEIAPVVPSSVLVSSAAPSAPADHTGSSVLPQPLQLTLTATEDCWIGLDVGGDRVENRVLKKGESFSISARQNASLAVGNAGGLLVAIDSGPARPLGNRGEVKRNIPLSAESISALSGRATPPPPTKPIG